ncbi:MAG: bifunctional 4-hydroxy-2-oxoglutarate aldolase/2-dehydro-3-deoxy-phosphogluconate aldolase [Chloroflexi bacterium]|nr:bifunctional 4-hydroxy-2-oxoglutarate aldolase/2-dehydro-3-deoxy-phosphogluconate aldolase [Chloroflexota bacterium]
MAQFDRMTVYNTILQDGMVPLFYHPDADVAQKVVGALSTGGSHVVEFTNRGDFAIEVFSQLVKYCRANHPTMIVGVGSVEDEATAALYAAHGANFIIGPTFNEAVARMCNRRKLPYVPGCGDLNTIAAAEEHGAEFVKMFPGSAVGGPGFVKAVLAPRPWSKIMPTGGVTPDETNLREWFDAGVACVGMGSQLIQSGWIKAGAFDKIADLTAATLELIRRIRSA